jgi:hypothetical protein
MNPNLAYRPIISLRQLMFGTALFTLLPFAPAASAATLKAEYRFNGTLASDVPGAPDLVTIDSLNANHFNADQVSGRTQQVFTWSGNASPVSQQAGLSLDSTGLVNATNYSVEMIFKLTDRDGAWRRLIDVSNRQSDDGFYVDPGDHLDVYPIISSITPFTNGVYEDVILTVGNGIVSAYLNGTLQFSGPSPLMNITSTVNPLIFFVDNDVGGGQGEFSNGSIALLRLYDGRVENPALTVQSTATNSVVLTWPSPSTGYFLQQNTNLTTTNWNFNAQVPIDDGTNKNVVVMSPVGNMFYRLYHP